MPEPRNAAPLDVFRRREHQIDDRRLRRDIDAGRAHRIAPGSYADARTWTRLTALERHATQVLEASARLRQGTVFSHHSAAAVWGMDILGRWPEVVDVSVGQASGGRSTGGVRRRTRDLSRVDALPWGRHFVTSPAQTAYDLAAVLPFVEGVAVVDQALWLKRPGGPLTTEAELAGVLGAMTSPRGAARARAVLEFARPGADSVRESQSRVVLDSLGFPEPVLQKEFLMPGGRVAFSDFYFPGFDHIGEFDGVGKYIDPALRRGRTTEQVLLEEKDREDALRRMVRSFSRWRTPELRDPRLLWDILTRAGLPTRRPRPGR